MSIHLVPYRSRALLLAACCSLLLAGCNSAAQEARVDGDGAFSLQPLAEREARHFDVYMQYRAVFDRPRRLLSDALQDDDGLQRTAMQFLTSDIGLCSGRGSSDD